MPESGPQGMNRRSFLKTIPAVAGAAFGVSASESVAQAQGVTREQAEQAMARIRPAILKHPETLVREKLVGWLETGRLQFAANNILPNMSASEERSGKKRQVLLWYNTGFIREMPDVASLEDKEALLSLIIYHEAIHIDDHFTGKMPLGPLIADAGVSSAEIAQDIWNKEWSAVTKEWELAKKIGKPYLMPVIYVATKSGETPQAFLEGFYQLQMTGEGAKLNPALLAGFKSRYEQEFAKLSSTEKSQDDSNPLYKVGIPAAVVGGGALALEALRRRRNKNIEEKRLAEIAKDQRIAEEIRQKKARKAAERKNKLK